MATESTTLPAANTQRRSLGWWSANGAPPVCASGALVESLHHVGEPTYVVDVEDGLGVASSGVARLGADRRADGEFPLRAFAPPLLPEQLGDRSFLDAHRLRYAYVAGAMANGITSEEIVIAMGQSGMVGFFGAAGLDLPRVEKAIERIQQSLGDLPYGFNLIHSPNDQQLEQAIVELYVRRGVRLVSASAYLGLTLPLLRYRLAGIHADAHGAVVAPNKVVAKVSRVEVARKFLSPAPTDMLQTLVAEGTLTQEQAKLAERIPVAEDITAEADSGGHTDNRPALALLPTILALRDEMQVAHSYACRLRVGAAGGIATPHSVAAAFAMGAAYVLTGSVNQACVEAGTSEPVREMLAKARQADVTMAPAADMFEMGVQVQVLKWGTMFAPRARKLYELYRAYGSIEELPAAHRKTLERDYFRTTLEDAWESTRRFFETRDPSQIDRAERDPKHKLALVFRAYLGQASGWANVGEASRRADYQIWCGPAMGAFNEWTKGTFLEEPARRDVVTVAMNLLVGGAALTRVASVRNQGVVLPAEASRFAPRTLDELQELGVEQ